MIRSTMAFALFRNKSDQRINVPIRTNTQRDSASRGRFTTSPLPITPKPDKRFPARGRAPPGHENMVKPLVMVVESVDL